MPVLTDTYMGPWWSISGQASSLVPYFTRRPDLPQYTRERLDTPDGDFIDIDWLRSGHRRLVILDHGLEGSSDSQYMRSAATLFSRHGYDVLAMNHRSCSGELNRTTTMYHSGFTDDLAFICETFKGAYKSIYLVGYSLGGNQVCRYICDGQHHLPAAIRRAVAISVPTDLADSAVQLARWYNYLYTVGFLRTLKDKGLAKAEQFPDLLSAQAIDSVKTLVAFDDVLTAPLHGFADAADYYAQCSSLPYLNNTRRPLLMINAADDPFLGDRCYPVLVAEQSSRFHLLVTRRGGHVGFMQPDSPWTYAEEQALAFCEADTV